MAGRDFVEYLGSDLSSRIFRSLDKPSDLLHAAAVSTSWRRLVKDNKMCKELCVRMFPQLSAVQHAATISSVDSFTKFDEHRVYASLARLIHAYPRNRILRSEIISASSYDRVYEGIERTRVPGNEANRRPFYWSRKGSSNPDVPDSLVHRLDSYLAVVTEIHVEPSKDIEGFEDGNPIYSAKEVRFRLGHENTFCQEPGKFVWTYVSPAFPLIQMKGIQRYVLPEPALCIGGIMMIEFLGRTARHPLEGSEIISVAYAEALGKVLTPHFSVNIIEQSGKFTMRHIPEACVMCSQTVRWRDESSEYETGTDQDSDSESEDS